MIVLAISTAHLVPINFPRFPFYGPIIQVPPLHSGVKGRLNTD